MAAYMDERIFPVLDAGNDRNGQRHPANDERTVYVGEDGMVDYSVDPMNDMEALSAEFRHRLGLLPDEEQELTEIFKARLGLTAVDEKRMANLNDKEHTLRNHPFQTYVQRNFQNSNQPAKFNKTPIAKPLLSKESQMDIQASLAISTAILRFMEFTPVAIPSGKPPKNSQKEKEKHQQPYLPVMAVVFKSLDPRNHTDLPPTMTPPAEYSGGNPLNGDSTEAGGTESGRGTKKQKSTVSGRRLSLKKIFSSIGKSSKKMNSVKAELARSQSVDENGTSSEDYASTLTSELDLVHFIIAHGIIKKDLRDEIFCQLCCQVTENPSLESRDRAWMLHALCAGCFMPSTQLVSFYFGFLYEASNDPTSAQYASYIMKILRRTNTNGPRYHPPNWKELQAVKLRKFAVLEVRLVDERTIQVEADSATTALEVCQNIASQISLEDHFGFSLYITVFEKVSSLGSGTDHVMDAVTECEHLSRGSGHTEESAPWRMFYRKELFTPWHDPALDPVATKLVYRQIVDGLPKEEFRIPQEILSTMVAQCLYVDHGQMKTVEVIKSHMTSYLPKTMTHKKSVDAEAKSIMDSCLKMSLHTSEPDRDEIQRQFVSNAAIFCSMSFSALFEAYRCGGPPLPTDDVILAVNSGGVAFLASSMNQVLARFKFYEIVEVYSNNSADISNATVTIMTIDGNQFTLLSPNSDVAAKIISAFLAGLRRRSRWAVAIRPFVLQDYRPSSEVNSFTLAQGDTIELMDEGQNPVMFEEWLYGMCERSGLTGSFPYDVVYIIPTATRPSEDFLDMLRIRGQTSEAESEERQRSALIMSDAGNGQQVGEDGLDSCA